MKAKIIILLAFLSIGFHSNLFSQDLATITTSTTCYGECDGSLSINIDAAQLEPDWILPFEVEYENLTTGESDYFQMNSFFAIVKSGLCAGEYEIFISLSETCEYVVSTTIESFPEIGPFTADISCICSPGGQGAIELVSAASSSLLSFEWNGPKGFTAKIQNLTGLTMIGEYTVAITSKNGCVIEQTYYLDECYFDLSNFNEEVVNACDGPGTGQIEVDIPVEVLNIQPPIHFAWLRMDGPAISSSQITSDGVNGISTVTQLDAGEYCLAITTDNGCSAQKCWTIEEETSPTVSAVITSAESGNDGAIDLSTSQTSGTLEYSWSNGATTQDISNLSAGTYIVEITYGDLEPACVLTLEYEVMGCTDLSNELSLEGNVTPMSSENANNAAINLSVINGENYSFIYEWTKTATGEVWNTEDLSNLSPGEYCVKVILEGGDCPAFVLSECYEICGFGFTLYTIPVNCLGSHYITSVSPPGDYTYEWSHASSQNFFTYGGNNQTISVTITDLNGCSMTKDIFVASPQLAYNYQVQNATSGQANGGIQIQAGGGTAPYTFTWDNGVTGSINPNLAPGTYCVTITDDCNASESTCIDVGCEISPNGIPGIVTPMDCSKGISGAIELDLKADNPNTLFFWSNGETTQNISDLSPGQYCVTMVNSSSGCSSSECYYVFSQGSGGLEVSIEVLKKGCYGGNNGELTANVTGGIGPYTFEWKDGDGIVQYTTQTISNIIPDEWQVIVTDANGCVASRFVELYRLESFITKVSINPNPVCEGQTASATIDVFNGTAPFNFEWKTCDVGTPLPGNSSSMNNLAVGCYSVKITDAEGCEKTIKFEVTESTEMTINPSINGTCNGTLGSVELAVSSGTQPYSYLWSNGQTSSSINQLNVGQYCVTVTDAADCTITDCYTIEDGLSILSTNVTDNICGSAVCTGAIDIEVNMTQNVSYSWSNGATTQNISQLCDGEYTVTITSGDCIAETSFTISSPPQEFAYDVEVNYYFNNDLYTSGAAEVYIYSDLFFSGDIYIEECDYEMFVSNGYTRLFLPSSCSSSSIFNFTYTDQNGCVYTGSFDAIPTCTFPDPGFSFSVDYTGGGQGACGPGQEHTYLVNVFNVGNNTPYFIEVSMLEASDPSESDYTQVIEYTGQNPFYIYGVPAGTVKFSAKNFCDNSVLSSDSHTNCCFELSCDILWDSPSDVDDGSHVYDYPYFRLWALDLCYDAHCGGIGHDPSCSKIEIDLNTAAPTYNCWTGTVTIEYPDGSTGVFEVIANSPGNDEIEWVSGDDNWKPSGPGSYFVNISYVGNGASTGQDCQTEQEVNWYGPGNYNDAVGFNDDFWFSASTVGAPANFMESYFSSWTCKACSEEQLYFFENEDKECKSFSSWQAIFFDFVPNDYTNPCNSGGQLSIIDFDNNGVATIQTVTVPANVAIDEALGLQPFGISINTWCSNSGWCLFDFMDVYGISSDKPLLATWAEPQTCEEIVWTDPSTPNPDPCLSDSDCPPGFVCVDGNCFEECLDGECLYGECIDGICVEGGDCNPSCPDGYNCIQNNCYLDEDVCNFYVSVSGGISPNTYSFYHNESPGTEITLWYNTLSRYDEIFISGSGIDDHIECVGEENQRDYTIGTGNTITVTVVPCESGSHYHLSLSCTEDFNKPPNNNTEGGNLSSDGLDVFPNPFNSKLEIIADEVDKSYRGQIYLIDNLGMEVLHSEVIFETGYNRFSIDGLEKLKDGMYFIIIKHESEILFTEKLIKME